MSHSTHHQWPNDASSGGKAYTVPEQAAGLVDFVQALGARPVHVVGGSFGARVALEAAVQ